MKNSYLFYLLTLVLVIIAVLSLLNNSFSIVEVFNATCLYLLVCKLVFNIK